MDLYIYRLSLSSSLVLRLGYIKAQKTLRVFRKLVFWIRTRVFLSRIDAGNVRSSPFTCVGSVTMEKTTLVFQTSSGETRAAVAHLAVINLLFWSVNNDKLLKMNRFTEHRTEESKNSN